MVVVSLFEGINCAPELLVVDWWLRADRLADERPEFVGWHVVEYGLDCLAAVGWRVGVDFEKDCHDVFAVAAPAVRTATARLDRVEATDRLHREIDALEDRIRVDEFQHRFTVSVLIAVSLTARRPAASVLSSAVLGSCSSRQILDTRRKHPDMEDVGAAERLRWFYRTDRLGAVLTAILIVISVVMVADLGHRLATGRTGAATFLTTLWNGLVFGMAIGLAGIGLAMTYSILKFANFAHGDYVTAGAFAGWMGTFVVAGVGTASLELLVLVSDDLSASGLGINILAGIRPVVAIFVGLVFAAVATGVLSLALDRILFKPMRDASGIALLIASVGLALAMRHIMQIVYGPETRTLTTGVPTLDFAVGGGVVRIGGHEVTLVVLAALLMVLTHVLLQYTKLGTAMRAMADNEDLALVTGIPTERVVRATWLVGGGLTGAAGFLIALESGAMDNTMGWDLLLVIFSGVILGGIGSVYGAMVGGIIMGLISQLSLIWLPSDLMVVTAFSVMIFILLIRPEGLFGGVETV